MVEAGFDAGLDVVIEKPWLASDAVTQRLDAIRTAKGKLAAGHYEYCLLNAVEAWRDRQAGDGLRFGGRMNQQRPGRTGLPALDNLGTHLFSIHEYAAPRSMIASIECSYQQPDDRRVWLDDGGRRVAEVDLLAGDEPIIQRFVTRFENARLEEEFPWGLRFARKITADVAEWRRSLATHARPAPPIPTRRTEAHP